MRIPAPLLPRSIRWLGVFAVAAFIFYASVVTVPETLIDETDPEIVPLHLWRHVVAYFGLAGALAYATDHWKLDRSKKALFVIGIAALYGGCVEIAQAFVPHRTDFMIIDVAANTLGAAGVITWYLLRPYVDLKSIPELMNQFTAWYSS